MAATYKLIDTTSIIPEIYDKYSLTDLLNMLRKTHCENIEQRHKIYITVHRGGVLYSIIFSDGITLYELNNKGIQKFNEQTPLDEKKVIEIEKFLKNEKKVSFKDINEIVIHDTTEIEFVEDVIPIENKNELKQQIRQLILEPLENDLK